METAETLIGFMERFDSEEKCLKYLTDTRFKDGAYCPHCGHTKVYLFSNNKTYKCAECRKKFNVKTGTIFEASKISLRKWFLAIFLLSTNKKGISSVELAEKLGVTQKTAWFMDHRIRETYKQNKGKLTGTVEVDETYIGGKEKNKHADKRSMWTQGRSTDVKTAVVGAIERNGEVRAKRIERADKKTIMKFMGEYVESGAIVYADEYKAYNGIANKRINHSKGQYFSKGVHTNSIESFWALFKRGYIGIYHYMSKKHLQRYLNEFSARLNGNRNELGNFDKFALSMLNINHRLTYQRLING